MFVCVKELRIGKGKKRTEIKIQTETNETKQRNVHNTSISRCQSSSFSAFVKFRSKKYSMFHHSPLLLLIAFFSSCSSTLQQSTFPVWFSVLNKLQLVFETCNRVQSNSIMIAMTINKSVVARFFPSIFDFSMISFFFCRGKFCSIS